MGTERYHKAARDGYLEALKEATKRDLNSRDEDGMTATLWAAFEGNLDALRLIVGRGGDPDKCDNYGNSALHFAAARGHMPCVTFLVNFGVNMWSLDIDFHTPKDLAAINNKEQILRFLDAALSKEETQDRKKVKALQEKAEKEAEKRVKEFDKIQKKATKSVEEEQRKLAKQREKMERDGGGTVSGAPQPQSATNNTRPTIPFMSLRSKTPPTSASPKFSDIVSSSNGGNAGGTLVSRLRPGAHFTGVSKKVQQKKTAAAGPEFKVADTEGVGKRSVRSLSGLRQSSEVMYVVPEGRRGKLDGLFEGDDMGGSEPLTRSHSQPDYLNGTGDQQRNGSFQDDQKLLPPSHTSIFDRPGFGSMAFRSSLSSTLSNFQVKKERSVIPEVGESQKRQNELLEVPSDEDDGSEPESGPLELFLEAAGILSFAPVFDREKIDLDALMLLTEEDLSSLGIPLGPRRKLLNAVRLRIDVLENPGEIMDSRL